MATFDLVFSGGGTLGVAYIGALEVLENARHGLRRVVGTSAGAITAALVAAGYESKELLALAREKVDGQPTFYSFLAPPNPPELLAAIKKSDSETRGLFGKSVELTVGKIADFLGSYYKTLAFSLRLALAAVKNDVNQAAVTAFLENVPLDNPTLAGTLSFLEFGGIFSADKFQAWLTAKLRQKIPDFDAGTTLRTLHTRVGRELTVVATDATAHRVLVLNHRTAPACPVVQALRMSMSIPLIFQEVVWQTGWGQYLDRDLAGHVAVDGAALSNFPIRYVAHGDDPEVRRAMGSLSDPRCEPVGLLLDAGAAVPGDIPAEAGWESKTVARLGRLVDTVTSGDEEVVRRNAAIVCRIPTQGYNPLEFALSDHRLDVLINSGRCAMTQHLSQRKLGR